MESLSAIEIKYLKRLKKNPNGVLPEKVEDIFGSYSEYALKSLQKDGFIERKPTKYDRVEMLMDLGEDHVVEFSGEWTLSEKGYAFLKENAYAKMIHFRSGFTGFLIGVITAILPVFIEFLLSK